MLAFTIFFYAVVYTMWLKRWTPQNIVIGGAAGAFPPMIGWAAATGGIGLESILLFLIIFFWTPPHFWALSLYRADEYRPRRRADAAGGRGRGGNPPADPALFAGAGAGRRVALAAGLLPGWPMASPRSSAALLMVALALQLYRAPDADGRAGGEAAVRHLDPLSVRAVRRAVWSSARSACSISALPFGRVFA